ncbi:MAG: 4-(cytidine 5'-diphospho)-2-C-methyl-D-erythritol kinase, partial [Planctomycetota bacterium]|nr:4-(cytidine 5'-diphospho)-2-C-methyl-D-erythritol kinase [Planctomycetota bacterium]
MSAPAKINLNLLVAPPRSDGFHPLDSYVARIDLFDTVELSPRRDGRITLACLGADCGPVESNLAYRAAVALAKFAPRGGVDIRLTKRIPPGAGLGGGSSDAATVLAGLNRLWNLAIEPGELSAIAATLGSDVPLFLAPPAARMTGRGEILRPVTCFPFHAILCLPGLHVPTPAVFGRFDALPHQPIAQLDEALLAGPPSAWRDRLVNQLAPAAHDVCPALDAWHDALAATRLPVCLSGSGSAMFILFD